MKVSGASRDSGMGRRLAAAAAVLSGAAVFVTTAGVDAQQAAPTAATCSITGTITGLGGPLPGVAITIRQGETVQTATSTGVDGTFRVVLPDNSYQLSAELTGFDRVQRDVVVNKADACTQAVDLAMTLAPRTAVAAAPRGRGAGPAAANGAPAARGARNGAPAAAASAEEAAQGRFESLVLQEDEVSSRLAASAFGPEGDPSSFLPSGFGSEALAEAFAVTGDGARVDNRMLNDRRDAINRNEFNLPQFDGRLADAGGFDGVNFQGGGRGGGGNFQGGGGRGGNNFQGGRGGNNRRIQGSINYSFSGSALSSPQRQLRSDVRRTQPPNANHNVNFQVRTPLRIPGLYENANNSTQLQFSVQTRVGTTLFDQTATVPTDAMRAGDFSSVTTPLIDPATGQQFEGNRIPVERMSPQAVALLNYYPAPNLPGNTRNYRFATTNPTQSANFSFSIQHNFSGQAAGNQGGGRGGGGGGGNFNNNNRQSNAGQAGRGQRLLGTRTNVSMTVNPSFSSDENDQLNVFTTLGGIRKTTQLGLPVSFQIRRGRVEHRIQTRYNYSSNETTNKFSGVTNVAQLIGIQGVSDNEFAWGLPRLNFSSISGLNDVTPSQQVAHRASGSYTFRRPFGRNHQVQIGGDYNHDVTTTNNESNANGQFVFTGIYSSGGGQLGGLTGFDFADFLLGMPQQASIAYGPGESTLTGRTVGMYFQDDWRILPSMTVQLGVRYDLLFPFVEENGKMVNLDVNTDFTGAAPVEAGEVGAFTGTFPKGLIETDTNNVSPKFGAAWRAPGAFVVRGSWEINYNSGTYSGIARRLAQQPPFATTGTNIGGLSTALLMENALTGIQVDDVRNNYGIDKDYVLGRVQQSAIILQRQLGQTFQASAQYTHSRGSNLEIVRAPNRDANGVRIEGVQPFTWTSSEGRSRLHSTALRLEKRQTRGFGYSVDYTWANSKDNSPSIGGGGGGNGNVAQDDRNIEAEWGRSSFEQRHRISISAQTELPFGPDRRWLYNGGFLASILDGWRVSSTFSWNSGRPYSVTVRGAARDIAGGINGALRADYNGEDLSVDDPTIDRWFNTDAFAIPATGAFGSSPRNIITGPGSKSLNANIQRQVRMGGNRNLSIRMNINNILDMANYSGIDTNVNSPTFGQVTGLSGARSATLNLQLGF